jgi:hypothetical protein
MHTSAVAYAFVAIVTFGGAAFAQQEAGQSPRPTTDELQTTGQAPRAIQAPVGHRQPRAADLPPDVGQAEKAPTPQDQELDQRLKICRNC